MAESTNKRVVAGLAKEGRSRILSEWEKAENRLITDPEGAITSARTVLESLCIHILDATGTAYASDGDLPKLYSLVSERLGLSARSQVSDINKRLFGSVHTIIQAVGELRNKVGDAHGRSFGDIKVSEAQARLAVSLAGSMIEFLLSSFESHLAAVHRLTSGGEAVLKFEKSTVWRLIDHARNAPTHLRSFGERKPKAALWLVGDAGIYLMSNGSPPQLADGSIRESEEAKEKKRLVAYADGCTPDDDLDDWWPIHNAIEGGSDFSITIPISEFDDPLALSDKQLVIIASETHYSVYADTEWPRAG